MAAKKSAPSSRLSAADALIAKAREASRTALPAAIKAEIAKIIEHNDAVPRNQRVSADAVLVMLRELGHPMGMHRFMHTVQQEFGRKWVEK